VSESIGTAGTIFLITLVATFAISALARLHSKGELRGDLAGRKLNRWFIGLSAATTANSGFIVTAAVRLGYVGGMQWVMLPISWFVGDLIFWAIFPERINAFGHESRATTLSEMLAFKLSGKWGAVVAILAAMVILVCLCGYTSAQWIAGQKFLTGAFGFPQYFGLALFAIVIIAYSTIGGFRGSVYTDTLQAFIRIVGTVIALVAISYVAISNSEVFVRNIQAAGAEFLNPFSGGTVVTVLGFVGGYAAAAIGFGLGQPQIISRYLAGSNPLETRSARWIYIGFVQFTWISMTLFGVLLRGVMPAIADPETGLSVFFQKNMNAVATGIIVADVFATIASTSNGLLVAMAQAITHDILPRIFPGKSERIPFAAITAAIGLTTMMIAALIHGTVVTLALASVSLMGAGLAPAVIIKVMYWRHSAFSLACAIVGGILSAIIWRYFGFGAHLNEAAIGIVCGLALNWLIAYRHNLHVSGEILAGKPN
jgi:Na+/proline symporter